eukprot:383415-Prymnesium_polylepis.2
MIAWTASPAGALSTHAFCSSLSAFILRSLASLAAQLTARSEASGHRVRSRVLRACVRATPLSCAACRARGWGSAEYAAPGCGGHACEREREGRTDAWRRAEGCASVTTRREVATV